MKPDRKEIINLARISHAQQVKWRRHFHKYPEISNNEFKTTDFINSILKKHKIRIIPLKGMKTGTAAIVQGKAGKGKTAAVRTDIDALPVKELNKVSFRSRHDGVMHACGHDVHMAVVLGTAVQLSRLKDTFAGDVKFIFQPSEEMPPGGAIEMIKAGILNKPEVNMIFGLHVDPTLPTGQFSILDGPTMASVIDFNITVTGQTGHAAVPHKAVDAIATAAEMIDSLQKVVSREVNPIETAVITFGAISGGSARNVIAGKVELKGTARTLSAKTRKLLPRLIKRTVDGVCRARGAKGVVDFIASYPVLSNHSSANKVLRRNMSGLFGRQTVKETPQVMGSEDFARYIEIVPGAMFRLGIKNTKLGSDKSWHSPSFMVDEEAILYGTAVMMASVLDFIAE